jgi:hypothetical protein
MKSFSYVGDLTVRHNSFAEHIVSVDVVALGAEAVRFHGIVEGGIVEVSAEASERFARPACNRLRESGWEATLVQTDEDTGWGKRYRVTAHHALSL